MVVAGDNALAELVTALRIFGWVRDLRDREWLANQHEEIDPRFLFVNIGYNLRPTEIQGAFGIHQLPRLDPFIELRRANAAYWTKCLGELSNYLLLPEERRGTRHVWFGYPVAVRPDAPFTRRDLTRFLESRGLETRPIMAGNIAEQPAMRMFRYRVADSLEIARRGQRQAFFFGNHHGIGEEEREAVVGYFREFLASHRR